MYRNGTYNVRSVYRSCTPICTEVVVPKWSAPCTEMVMYRTGPTPPVHRHITVWSCLQVVTQLSFTEYLSTWSTVDDYHLVAVAGRYIPTAIASHCCVCHSSTCLGEWRPGILLVDYVSVEMSGHIPRYWFQKLSNTWNDLQGRWRSSVTTLLYRKHIIIIRVTDRNSWDMFWWNLSTKLKGWGLL